MSRLKEKLTKLKDEMGKLAVYEKQMRASPDQQISLTDSDGRSMATSGRGSGVVGYNVQVAVDTEHRRRPVHADEMLPRPRSEAPSKGIIKRMNGGWRVTDKGRSVLEIMEARSAPAQATELTPVRAVEEPTLATTLSPMPSIALVRRKRDRNRRQRDTVRRRQTNAS
ncbi:uncharacterized protein NK6_c_22 (plasmid) [Bradyrhizobium diazoefficiens]|uniref:Uncharacterized protein n=1 Tax=Bradyrhizobium diazoefficiens TaxID=1355477 RepID=A0A0E4BYL1_9BRAD|nr:uncharacterized protein NK6_c_22 [Bradyrhizobium diazoefficiens]